MSNAATDKRKVGEIRPSQLLFTYGVGAMVELPNLSVMVMGLDDWPIEQGSSEITEPRLLKAVQQELGRQVVKLLTPPVTSESTGYQASPFDDTANVGVPGRPVPALAGLPVLPPAGPDPVGPLRVAARPLPQGPQPLRPPDLQEAGEAAHGRPGPLPRRLRARPPRRFPLGRVRASGQDGLPL